MKKIKIAMLWHFHQPIYLKNNEFILPWVRLHGVKDYKDLPELFYEFPKIKQTINIVPSMYRQINYYIFNGVSDKIQELSLKNPEELSENEKSEIMRLFFLCNVENMINPYPEYRALYDKKEANIPLSDQEIIDLQVWYNLTWVGRFSRQNPAVKSLFDKAKNFSKNDKVLILDLHLEILSSIKRNLLRLKQLGVLEISVSPYNHPILPLLCDTDSLLEAMPNAILPEEKFQYPQDADAQIKSAKVFYEENFNDKICGMWPSEGSISDNVLKIMIDNGVQWVASDELVLKNSLGEKYQEEYKYFPAKYHTNQGDIAIFFRDHSLSDAIGFQYAAWDPQDATNDFIKKIENIRNFVIDKCGEEALENVVVPIILDGENCWEYFKNNGFDFLRKLFKSLENNANIETVHFSEMAKKYSDNVPVLEHLCAGSWINANFEIWAGQEEHRIAWSMLSKARKCLENKLTTLTDHDKNEVLDLIYIAESSDWFWWYGDKHWAENKFDFDVLFRWYLQMIYEKLGQNVPDEVLVPISKYFKNHINSQAKSAIDENNNIYEREFWNNSACFYPNMSQSSMHKVGELIEEINVGNADDNIFIRLKIIENVNDAYSIDLKMPDFEVKITDKGLKTDMNKRKLIRFEKYNNELYLKINIPEILAKDYVTLDISTYYNESDIIIPLQNIKIF